VLLLRLLLLPLMQLLLLLLLLPRCPPQASYHLQQEKGAHSAGQLIGCGCMQLFI
jgi:hypothetical protein